MSGQIRRIVFLRRTEQRKNGRAHSYWSVVENKRLDDGSAVQRHLLYSGEINSSQAPPRITAAAVNQTSRRSEEPLSQAIDLFDADPLKTAESAKTD